MAFVFLSYNHADTEDARAIAAHLKLAGADVWIDEWEVRAGDSIPGKLNEGLSAFDTFVLVWSESAARSNWVREELQSAIQRGIDDEATRIVPVLIDRTPLPPLLAHLRYLRIDEGAAKVVDEILGFTTERSRIMAIQQTLGEAGIDVRDIPGYGPIVGCPKCGAGLKSISGWMQTDYERDDVYAGARCAECGWSDGGEI
jgi:hypothetical protein